MLIDTGNSSNSAEVMQLNWHYIYHYYKKIMKQYYFPTVLCLLIILDFSSAKAQISLNQDCINAVTLCNARSVFPYGFQGQGENNDLTNRSSCLVTGEKNSSWYLINIGSSGNLAFTIITLSSTNDYDFALYDITGLSCNEITTDSAVEVRCSFASTMGIPTGIRANGTGTSAGSADSSFLEWLAVDSGDVFALLVNSYTLGGAGFAIDFDSTTAILIDGQDLKINQGLAAFCEDTMYTELYFNYPIDCASVSSDFSEFSIVDNTGSSLAVTNILCDSAANRLIIEFERPTYPIDSITVHYADGSDGNTVKPSCGSKYIAAGNFGFGYIYNNMGSFGFSATNAGKRYSFLPNVVNVPFVDWYVNGTFLITQQASLSFNYSLSQGQSYNICMVATLGCNKDSSCQSFLYTNIDEVIDWSRLMLYPNPTSGNLIVSLPFGAQSLEVMDINGKVISRFGDVQIGQQITLNTIDMPQGLYFVRVQHPYGIATQKLQVIH